MEARNEDVDRYLRFADLTGPVRRQAEVRLPVVRPQWVDTKTASTSERVNSFSVADTARGRRSSSDAASTQPAELETFPSVYREARRRGSRLEAWPLTTFGLSG